MASIGRSARVVAVVLLAWALVAGCSGGGQPPLLDGSGTGSAAAPSTGGSGGGSQPGGSTGGGSTGGGTSTPAYEVAVWFPPWDTARAEASLWREAQSIDTVHLFWHYMRADGTIATRSGLRLGLVADCQAAGLRVVPTITDGFASGRASAVLGNATSRAAHVQHIVDLVVAQGYDGVDLDYEAMGAGDAANFSLFVEELSTALHALGKIVTVAVYGKTSAGSWSGPLSHDYARLGAAADRLNIMGYGYGYSGGAPNPIGPVHWIERVAAYAVSVAPASKIMMGLPFYAYDWPDGGNGVALTHDGVVSRLNQYSPQVGYNPRNGESTFSYSTSSGTHHTVWYQSPEGFRDKCQVVRTCGLRGIAIWRMGGEDPDLWGSIRAILLPTIP